MLRIGGQKVPPKTLLMAASDGSFIVLGLLLATALRFVNDDGIVRHHLFTHEMLWRFTLVVLVCELSLYYNDLYSSEVINRHDLLLVRTLQALGFACVSLALLYYVEPNLSLGRGIAALAAPLILTMTLGWRVIVNKTGLLFIHPERVLILGTSPEGIELVREIIRRPELHLKVVGFLDERGENIGKSLVNPGIIGAVNDVEGIVERERIDHVVLSLAERRGCTPARQLLHLKFAGVHVDDAHSYYERVTGRILLERLSPSWLILSEGFRKSRFLLASKRAIDIIVSSLLLALFLPIMGVVALAIWLESGSPIFFRQTRVGLKGKDFEVLKFRSMIQDAEKDGPKWAVQDDHRVTQVGQSIRKFRLDELPQLINVLRGEMSLVGPRPERPHFCSLLEQQIPFFGQRHAVRPGVTGWAQIKYSYGSTVEDAKAKLELDLFYIKNLSVMLDLAIIFETAKVMLLQRGAK